MYWNAADLGKEMVPFQYSFMAYNALKVAYHISCDVGPKQNFQEAVHMTMMLQSIVVSMYIFCITVVQWFIVTSFNGAITHCIFRKNLKSSSLKT